MTEQRKIKWGIIGLGNIAHQFVKDLQLVDDAIVYAVASRSEEKANTFSQQYKVPYAYGSYAELMNNDDIDIVYIATPHHSHACIAIDCMMAGKAVLCEKPIALTFEETKKMVTTSKMNNTFLMEALWTRFNPSVREMLYKVQQEEIGEVHYINADFAFKVPNNLMTTRMTDTAMGGGSLMDMGVYPVFLSYLILGKPQSIKASATFYDSGADKQTAIIFQYKNAQAVMHSSFASSSNMMATISGEEGRINLNGIWHETQSYSVVKNGHNIDYHWPTQGKGFTYEIEECHNCLRNNKIESDVWSHQNSLDLIQLVDQIRTETGLTFKN